MKLENQLSNKEYSKRLEELGVKQESYWSWVLRKGRKGMDKSDDIYLLETDGTYYFKKEEQWCAFTVAELGEMLPKHIHNPKKDTPGTIDGQGDLTIRWVVEGCLVGYDCLSERLRKLEERLVPTMIDVSEANARAQMLIYLLENNLLEL